MRARSVVALTGAISVLLASLGDGRNLDGLPRERLLLIKAARSHRLLEPRLSGFGWAPWNATRGVSDAPPDQRASVFAAVAQLRRQLTSFPTDQDMTFEWGVGQLLVGDLEGARTAFDGATFRSLSAARLSDLAAFFYMRAVDLNEPAELARALDFAARATRMDASLLEPRFNRALILGMLGPPSAARNAWEDYLSRDSTSGWADEARLRLNSAPAVNSARRFAALPPEFENPGKLREHLEDAVLVKWANSEIGSAGDRTTLEEAAVLADALFSATGDPQTRDLIRDLEQGTLAPPAVARRGYREAQAARQEIVQANAIDAARLKLAYARQTLGRSPAASAFIDYWWLLTEWYRRPAQDLEVPLRTLEARAAANGYVFLASRTSILLGSVLHRLTRYSEAIEKYQAGIDGLSRGGEVEAEAGSQMLLATALHDHGLWAEAWRNEQRALARFDKLAIAARRHNVLREAVRLCLARGQADAAAVFVEILSAESRAWGDRGALVESHILSGRTHLLRGARHDAERELDMARQAFEAIPDPAFRRSYSLDLLTLRAELAVGNSAAESADIAAELVAESSKSGWLFRQVKAHLLLGRALAAGDRSRDAASAWRRGIEILEDESAGVLQEQMRISRTSEVWDIYDELIALELRNGSPDQALQVAERGRARALLASIERQGARASRRDVDPRRLAGTVVFYAAMPEEILIWVIADGQAILRRVACTEGQFRELTGNLIRLGRSEAALAILESLHQVLIEPISDLIRGKFKLTIIPDDLAAAVPFGALRSRQGSRFLVEEHEIEITPSLSLLDMPASPERAAPPQRALILGDPAFDSGTTLRLPRLPGARDEAARIGALYPEPTTLIGDQATPQAFLRAAAGSDVIHFAGHAISDPDYPARSFLVLAGSPPSSFIHAADISGAQLSGVQVAVLSACSTFQGEGKRGEGVLSLARPFLAAGVPRVVATLWPVGDGIAPLLVLFHRRLAAGDSAASALRAAQLEAIQQQVDLTDWAAFVLVGTESQATGPDWVERGDKK